MGCTGYGPAVRGATRGDGKCIGMRVLDCCAKKQRNGRLVASGMLSRCGAGVLSKCGQQGPGNA